MPSFPTNQRYVADKVESILLLPQDPNLVDGDGIRPLSWAARRGHLRESWEQLLIFGYYTSKERATWQ